MSSYLLCNLEVGDRFLVVSLFMYIHAGSIALRPGELLG